MTTCIFAYLRKHLPLVALAACLWIAAGCSDELNAPGGTDVAEGLPAVLSLRLDLGDMTPISRADLPEGHDRDITSLWVAVFNVKTGARTGLYTSEDDVEFLNFHDNKNITIETLSGESYIVAVANYRLRYATTGPGEKPKLLSEALDDADTWAKYCDIAVFFDENGQSYVEAPANALVMSGYYVASGNAGHTGRPDMSTVTIKPDSYSPAGAVHLRRLISQVKFNVSFDTKTVKSCKVNSWSVSKVPSNAWLHERTATEIENGRILSAETDKPINSFDTRIAPGSVGFNKTDDFTTVTAGGKGFEYSFDFWMLENKRTGIITEIGDDETKIYRKREEEYKIKEDNTIYDPDTDKKNVSVTNTGYYTSLVKSAPTNDPNNNATFVTFHVVMEMNVKEDGTPLESGTRRIVETDYVVHLGYIGKDKNDFNCFRNSKYTYNVTIKNVNNVIVEAKKEGEDNPGVEGFVSDISDNYIELDAHYGVFNIELKADEIASFRYYMEVPKMDGTMLYITEKNTPDAKSDDYQYFKWVELRKTTAADDIAPYKPLTDSETFLLNEIKAPGYYTVFVNEYVYEDATDGNESNSTNWLDYVNKPSRRVWLNVSTHVSADKNSVYHESKYAFSQKSIQCYYDTDNPNLKSAIGAEHRNETLGIALRNTFNPKRNTYNQDITSKTGRNSVAGRFNVAQYISGSTGTGLTWYDNNYLWNKYLSKNTLQTVPAVVNKQGMDTPARTEYLRANITGNTRLNEYNLAAVTEYDPSTSTMEAISACLNRNRDLDGDGYIDAGELRWFVPTSAQYVRLILGRQSLEDPLLDPVGLTQLTYKGSNEYNSRFLFYTSDGQILWAMEGTSLGPYRDDKDYAIPWEIRCVRNLGSNMTEINKTAANQPAFKLVKDKNIVDMRSYDPASLRQEAYIDHPIPIHHINDQQHNRSYRVFEYKNELIALNGKDFTDKDSKYYVDDNDSWSSYITRVNPCDRYNVDGEKGWRLPNQKELSILGILCNIESDLTFLLGCTFAFFDNEGKVPDANTVISSDTRHEMKLRPSDGAGTQWGNLTEGSHIKYDLYGYTFGFRCVRDYTGALE